jgi:RNA polymerase sigma-70 factor (ECF subfamily)
MGYLLQLTSDYGLAEELLQDTLLAIWSSATTFAGRSRPRTWLFGVARRQAHNTLRRRGIPLARASEEEELALLQDPGPGPEDAVLARAGQAEMVQALTRLSTAHREVLILAIVHGLPQHDLVEILGVPLGTVKSRLHAAKRALRTLLTTTIGERV